MRTFQCLVVILMAAFVALSAQPSAAACGGQTVTRLCSSVVDCNAKLPPCGSISLRFRSINEDDSVSCFVKACGENNGVDLTWEELYDNPNSGSQPTTAQCNMIGKDLRICETFQIPECPEPEFSGVDDCPFGDCFGAPGEVDRLAVGAYVDLPEHQLANPKRVAKVFFGVDSLDRLTLLAAELWGVTEKSAGGYMEHLYERLPGSSILERTDSHYELLLPDGGHLAFDRDEATHPMWDGVVVRTLVLTSGQGSEEAAKILGLTPITVTDADRRRAALRRTKGR